MAASGLEETYFSERNDFNRKVLQISVLTTWLMKAESALFKSCAGLKLFSIKSSFKVQLLKEQCIYFFTFLNFYI